MSQELMTFLLGLASTLVVLVFGAIGWLYRHEREKRLAVERQLSEHKYKAYIALLKIFFDMLKASKKKGPVDESALVEPMIDANNELLLYGSDDVVRTYQKWLVTARSGMPDIKGFGEVIVAIRRDMGNPKTKLTADDVLRQFITDFDDAKKRGLV